jgi:hypothetical protein
MTVLVRPPARSDSVETLVGPRRSDTPLVGAPVAPASPEATSSLLSSASRRWLLVLGPPFASGAMVFGLALALGAEWPMVPAFQLGPFLLIAGYVYLSLTSDSNR